MIAKWGGGATETWGGGFGASRAAELLRDSLAGETMMQWRNKNSILLAFERFKPVETESILRDRGAWQRKMILATHQY